MITTISRDDLKAKLDRKEKFRLVEAQPEEKFQSLEQRMRVVLGLSGECGGGASQFLYASRFLQSLPPHPSPAPLGEGDSLGTVSSSGERSKPCFFKRVGSDSRSPEQDRCSCATRISRVFTEKNLRQCRPEVTHS